jgi:O6-methylguanine-DNA--protein-cysteine methyltransferase
LRGKSTVFYLSHGADGTPFQKSVWDALLKIPYGKTATYAKSQWLWGIQKGRAP